jgi:hypothetical protein
VDGGDVRAGRPVVVEGGRWSVPGMSPTGYQWLRAGVPIPGATSATYVPQIADVGKELQVDVTSSTPGVWPSTDRTGGAVVLPAPGPAVLSRPTLTGTLKVGSVLKAVPGTWSLTGLTYQYTWLREVGGEWQMAGTGAAYTLTAKDAGHRISVDVTARKTGYAETSVRSAITKPVPLILPTVTIVSAPSVITTKTEAKVVVTVTGSTFTRPVGWVVVSWGGRKGTHYFISSASKGVAVVQMPRLARGTYSLTATFVPLATTNPWLGQSTGAATKVLRVK